MSDHPTQAATSSTDYFIEGWTETYGPESQTITWNVSPTHPHDQVLIIDDPVRGRLARSRSASRSPALREDRTTTRFASVVRVKSSS
jgi:hypothetical protein